MQRVEEWSSQQEEKLLTTWKAPPLWDIGLDPAGTFMNIWMPQKVAVPEIGQNMELGPHPLEEMLRPLLLELHRLDLSCFQTLDGKKLGHCWSWGMLEHVGAVVESCITFSRVYCIHMYMNYIRIIYIYIYICACVYACVHF